MKGTMFNDRLVVSIDIGTTKICVLIAQHFDGDNVHIIGIGKSPSDGLARGVVVDIAKTVVSIKNAVKEAELMAGCKVDSAYIGISGGHIQSFNSQGMVPIKRGEIKQSDIDQAITSAKAITIPKGQHILHVLPQYFTIDSTEVVMDPLGMHGVRLEVQAHIITGSVASVQNLIKCCEMAGVRVADIVLEQLASAQAVLSQDERELGIAMLDIGGGTSDLALYHHGSIRHTMVLPVAGNHFTNDIAIGLHTTLKEAERIKKEYGWSYLPTLPQDNEIEVFAVDGLKRHRVMQSDLVSIIQPRAFEILTLVHNNIQKHKLQAHMRAGFVLTGGGALMGGMQHLASTIFNVPVRIGNPQLQNDFAAMLGTPIYATGYGLLLYAVKKNDTATSSTLSGPLKIFARMKSWVSDFF